MGRLSVGIALVVAGAMACSSPSGTNDGGTNSKPTVTLTVKENNVIGTAITGNVSVSGCKTVAQVRLLSGGSFLKDANYTKNPTAWDIPGSLLNPVFAAKGFPAGLSLSAEVLCDDGRSNVSKNVAVTFFPVASRLTSANNAQMLPDSFIAEGGIGNAPTTFLGCSGGAVENKVVRVDTNGVIVAEANFLSNCQCTYDAIFSDKNAAKGTRWMMVPGKCAVAFDQALNETNAVFGELSAYFGVSPDGDGIFVDETIQKERVMRVSPTGGTGVAKWKATYGGQPNAVPVVDVGNKWVYTSFFQYRMTSGDGEIVMIQYNYDTGEKVNADASGNVGVLVRQNYALGNMPVMPNAAFNADGTLLVVPILTYDVNQVPHSFVVACASTAPGCMGASRRWASEIVNTEIYNTIAYSNGNIFAAVGPYATFFLDASTGVTRNLGKLGVSPGGDRITHAVQPGRGADFYILAGPVPPTGSLSFPTEIITVDSPDNGELWRMQIEGGQSPTGGMYVAIDEGGRAWVRLGLDQIKPLTNVEYRTVRGATPIP